jgi:tRNA dimethylallyltransferase
VDGIAVHLVDIHDPNDPFTAADFVRLASAAITEIRSRNVEPILVGGTGLYFRALSEGLAELPPRDEALRAQLRARADQEGRAALHAELARVDPVAAGKIPANNIQRVLRALEVFHLTQKPISAWHAEHQRDQKNKPSAFPMKMIGIELDKSELHRRIAQRCAQMVADGIIDETRALLAQGYSPNCPALTGLGYPRVIQFLNGKLTREQMQHFLEQDTRQYAKRQVTWFKHQAEVQWNRS